MNEIKSLYWKMFYDQDTGELITQEEYIRRTEEKELMNKSNV